MAQEYGKLPHELLKLSLFEFDFDLAITFIADKKQKELEEKEIDNSSDQTKNNFASKSGGTGFTQTEFEKAFKLKN